MVKLHTLYAIVFTDVVRSHVPWLYTVCWPTAGIVCWVSVGIHWYQHLYGRYGKCHAILTHTRSAMHYAMPLFGRSVNVFLNQFWNNWG